MPSLAYRSGEQADAVRLGDSSLRYPIRSGPDKLN